MVDSKIDFKAVNRLVATQCSFAAIKIVLHEIFYRKKENFPAGLHSLVPDDYLILGLDIFQPDLFFIFALLESSLGYIKQLGRLYSNCRFDVLPGHESFLRADRTPTGLAILKHSVQLSESGQYLWKS